MPKWKLTAALGLSCGIAGVAWGFAQQPREPGVFELRIYTTLPGKRDALAARFGDYTTRIYERHGIRNVGYWLAAPPARTPTARSCICGDTLLDARETSDSAQRTPIRSSMRS